MEIFKVMRRKLFTPFLGWQQWCYVALKMAVLYSTLNLKMSYFDVAVKTSSNIIAQNFKSIYSILNHDHNLRLPAEFYTTDKRLSNRESIKVCMDT